MEAVLVGMLSAFDNSPSSKLEFFYVGQATSFAARLRTHFKGAAASKGWVDWILVAMKKSAQMSLVQYWELYKEPEFSETLDDHLKVTLARDALEKHFFICVNDVALYPMVNVDTEFSASNRMAMHRLTDQEKEICTELEAMGLDNNSVKMSKLLNQLRITNNLLHGTHSVKCHMNAKSKQLFVSVHLPGTLVQPFMLAKDEQFLNGDAKIKLDHSGAIHVTVTSTSGEQKVCPFVDYIRVDLAQIITRAQGVTFTFTKRPPKMEKGASLKNRGYTIIRVTGTKHEFGSGKRSDVEFFQHLKFNRAVHPKQAAVLQLVGAQVSLKLDDEELLTPAASVPSPTLSKYIFDDSIWFPGQLSKSPLYKTAVYGTHTLPTNNSDRSPRIKVTGGITYYEHDKKKKTPEVSFASSQWKKRESITLSLKKGKHRYTLTAAGQREEKTKVLAHEFTKIIDHWCRK